MVRLAYALLWYCLTPLIWLRLAWRARKQPEYLQNLGERYGFYRQTPFNKLIWVHAVSVGETRAAQPLIEGLLAQWPEHRILLTGMTPTGRQTGAEVYGARFGERVLQVYLPYDYPGGVRRFFAHFNPAFGVLMGRWLHLPPLQLQVAVVFCALPTASSAYVLAARMGGNGPFVAFLISASTVLSVVTLPIWVAMAHA